MRPRPAARRTHTVPLGSRPLLNHATRICLFIIRSSTAGEDPCQAAGACQHGAARHQRAGGPVPLCAPLHAPPCTRPLRAPRGGLPRPRPARLAPHPPLPSACSPGRGDCGAAAGQRGPCLARGRRVRSSCGGGGRAGLAVFQKGLEPGGPQGCSTHMPCCCQAGWGWGGGMGQQSWRHFKQGRASITGWSQRFCMVDATGWTAAPGVASCFSLPHAAEQGMRRLLISQLLLDRCRLPHSTRQPPPLLLCTLSTGLHQRLGEPPRVLAALHPEAAGPG